MSSFEFVHASHLHLDAPMRGVDSVRAELRAALRDASLNAWDALVRLAIERRAAFLLIAGGLYGGEAPTARARAALLAGVLSLRDAGIPTLVCLGAEDGAVGPETASALARVATVFEASRFSAFPVTRDGLRLATVHGASSSRPVSEPPPLPHARSRPGSGLQIALAPADPLPHGRPPDGARARADAGFDYWALGDSHQWAQLHERPWVVCAGTPQGRAPEPAESGAKGAVIVAVEDDRVARVELAELDRVRFLTLHVDAEDPGDVTALAAKLRRRFESETTATTAEIALVDVTLGGDFRDRDVDRPSLAARLLAELRRAAVRATPAVHWNGVHDQRCAARQSAAKPGSLARVVGERGEGLANATLPRSTFLAARFEPLRRVCGPWAAELDVPSAPELVREASLRAVDLLAAETSDENYQLVD